jgi:hypothetical protein
MIKIEYGKAINYYLKAPPNGVRMEDQWNLAVTLPLWKHSKKLLEFIIEMYSKFINLIIKSMKTCKLKVSIKSIHPGSYKQNERIIWSLFHYAFIIKLFEV